MDLLYDVIMDNDLFFFAEGKIGFGVQSGMKVERLLETIKRRPTLPDHVAILVDINYISTVSNVSSTVYCESKCVKSQYLYSPPSLRSLCPVVEGGRLPPPRDPAARLAGCSEKAKAFDHMYFYFY
jgi:hypothetical protein